MAWTDEPYGWGVVTLEQVRILICLSFWACLCAAQELVPIEKPAQRFFETTGAEPGELGRIVSRWRVPNLGALEFVSDKHHSQGSRVGGKGVLVAPYYLRPLKSFAELTATGRRKGLARAIARRHWTAQQLLLAHWIAAIQADDFEAAGTAWEAVSKRGLPFGELMFTWRSVWTDYKHPEFALAALRAMESIATKPHEREMARRQSAGVVATPQTVPEQALTPKALIQRLREYRGTGVEFLPGGSQIVFDREDEVSRLHKMGIRAYPALVAALEHKGLTWVWRGRMTWLEYLSFGDVAGIILRAQLGFLKKPATMRAWIKSGAWRDRKRTEAWFRQHPE